MFLNPVNGSMAPLRALKKKLEERVMSDSLRSLKIHQNGVDFFSNDYLGLAKNNLLHQRITQRFLAGTSINGSGGSRLLGGNSEIAASTEAELATFFSTESALIFNSGYDANVGIFQAITDRHTHLFYDELCHASIRDGIRLSTAKSMRFSHNNCHDLESLLKKSDGEKIVVVESIYSMDGDSAPLIEMADLCRRHQAVMIVDDAHGGAVFGTDGRGLAAITEIQDVLLARLVTFGKGFGVHGAAWLGSIELIHALINFCRSFIYTTAPAPIHYLAISEAVKLCVESQPERDRLRSLISSFGKLFSDSPKVNAKPGPIQSVMQPGNSAVRALAKKMNDAGIIALPILSPTVPEGKERIRICLHSYNTENEIHLLKNLV